MTRHWLVAGVIGALLPFVAAAYPEGAPWPEGRRPGTACASCHFDAPPVESSTALDLTGINHEIRAGKTYKLTLRFAPASGKVAGFLASFATAKGGAGVIADARGLESNGSSVRSTVPKALAGEPAFWTFYWTAPQDPGRVMVHVAANAANDDGSPFGDEVHYRMFAIQVG